MPQEGHSSDNRDPTPDPLDLTFEPAHPLSQAPRWWTALCCASRTPSPTSAQAAMLPDPSRPPPSQTHSWQVRTWGPLGVHIVSSLGVRLRTSPVHQVTWTQSSKTQPKHTNNFLQSSCLTFPSRDWVKVFSSNDNKPETMQLVSSHVKQPSHLLTHLKHMLLSLQCHRRLGEGCPNAGHRQLALLPLLSRLEDFAFVVMENASPAVTHRPCYGRLQRCEFRTLDRITATAEFNKHSMCDCSLEHTHMPLLLMAAGDWVKGVAHGANGLSQERAWVTGLIAANLVVQRLGLGKPAVSHGQAVSLCGRFLFQGIIRAIPVSDTFLEIASLGDRFHPQQISMQVMLDSDPLVAGNTLFQE